MKDQELEHYIHLDIISDHNVQVFVLKLKSKALPLILWKHLINKFRVVFLERRNDLKDALPLHPEPCRQPPVHEARHALERVFGDT